MELKLHTELLRTNLVYLLIVPYGIETTFCNLFCTRPSPLLIVPYGIETIKTAVLNGIDEELLIVPYGIETVR